MAKRKKNTLIYILIIAIPILAAIAYFSGKNQKDGEKVNVEAVQKRTIKETVAASGKIFPQTEVKISSDVSGEVVELYVEEGDSVKAGQLLAKIDPDAYQSVVERGVASVNNSKAQFANTKAGIERSKAQKLQAIAQKEQVVIQLANLKEIHQRNIKLHEDGVISQADFDKSLTNLKDLEANIRGLEANLKTADANLEAAIQSAKAAEFMVKSSEASLKESQTNLRRTILYAPTSGIISVLNVEQGERVVGTIQMTGTELMRIANLNAMEVQVDVSENDVLRLALNDKVDIEVDAYLGRKFKGMVTQIANSASNSSSEALTTDQVTNFIVKININADSYKDLIKGNKKYPFRPGMSATVEINTETMEGILAVPIQAVTTREDKDKKAKKVAKETEDKIKEVIFLCQGDTVKMIEVKTGIQDDDYIQILSGLSEGDEIVKGPYAAVSKKLKEGKKIQKVTEDDLYGENSDDDDDD